MATARLANLATHVHAPLTIRHCLAPPANTASVLG
jgi:hypothetical protein